MQHETESFWGGERAQRVHPRLIADLLLDSIEFHEEPATMMRHLQRLQYSPDYVRCKGYVGVSGEEVVCILPFTSDDLQSVAGLGIRRRLDQEDENASAHATIVRLASGLTPIDFTALAVLEGEVRTFGPVGFAELMTEGVRSVQMRLSGDEEEDVPPTAFARLSKGRAIAVAAVEDLAREERDIGFISPSEYQAIVRDVELYADVARVHSYLAATELRASGCTACTSSSSYACSSCSCNLNLKVA